MIDKNKEEFTGQVDGAPVQLAVVRPGVKENQQAQRIWNKTFNECINLDPPSPLRLQLNDIMRKQGLWNDEKEATFSSLRQEIIDGERALHKGGIKKSDAKKIALKMKSTRKEMTAMLSNTSELDSITAEGQADNAKYNYLISVCLVYNDTNKPFFKSYEDYLSQSGNLITMTAAKLFTSMIYGIDSNGQAQLPENKFLIEHKFADDNLRLINKDGKLVDEEGRLINEFNQYINDKGELVDKDGFTVDAEGNYNFESLPFLDDEE